MKQHLALFYMTLVGCSCSAQLTGPEAMLTLKVENGTGMPVEGARVAIYADVYGKNKVVADTDETGKADGSVRTFAGSLFFGVSAEGYYKSNGQFDFRSDSMKGDPSTWSPLRWQPWNPTVEVVLKEKGPLLPMYARRIPTIELPGAGEGVGYDFEVGDWIAPQGEGKTADLIFTGTGDVAAGTYRLRWAFSNPGDGIRVVPGDSGAKSELKSPKQAPADGYASSVEIGADGRVAGADGASGERPACLVFRVRTVLDENGEVVSAHYGKIYPERLNVVYYFNPEPNVRSLEYDPKRNLFRDASSSGRINDY